MICLEGFDLNILFTQIKLFQIVLHNSLCTFHSVDMIMNWHKLNLPIYAQDCVIFDFSSIHYHLLFLS